MATAAGDKCPAVETRTSRECQRGNTFDRQRQIERGIEDKEREKIATMEARRNNVATGPTGDPLMLLGVIAGDLTFACHI